MPVCLANLAETKLTDAPESNRMLALAAAALPENIIRGILAEPFLAAVRILLVNRPASQKSCQRQKQDTALATSQDFGQLPTYCLPATYEPNLLLALSEQHESLSTRAMQQACYHVLKHKQTSKWAFQQTQSADA